MQTGSFEHLVRGRQLPAVWTQLLTGGPRSPQRHRGAPAADHSPTGQHRNVSSGNTSRSHGSLLPAPLVTKGQQTRPPAFRKVENAHCVTHGPKQNHHTSQTIPRTLAVKRVGKICHPERLHCTREVRKRRLHIRSENVGSGQQTPGKATAGLGPSPYILVSTLRTRGWSSELALASAQAAVLCGAQAKGKR